MNPIHELIQQVTNRPIKFISPPIPHPTPPHLTKFIQQGDGESPIWVARMCATAVEIIGGQPLDRWKVNQQLPRAMRLTYTELFRAGLYTASRVSIIQRCCFYIPGMFYVSDITKKHFSTNPLIVGATVSLVMTPTISIFENIKTEYQLKRAQGPIRYVIQSLYERYGFRGLFPTLPATFMRESMFAMAVCSLVPYVNTYVNNNIVAGIATGMTVQFFSHPFDTIKTRQEHTKETFWQTARTTTRFWAGVYPRCIRGAWTVTCLHYCTKVFSSLIEGGASSNVKTSS